MPHIYNSISRKTFLKRSLKVAGIAMLPQPLLKFDFLNNKADVVNLALLSDTHIAADAENNYRGCYPFKNLNEVR